MTSLSSFIAAVRARWAAGASISVGLDGGPDRLPDGVGTGIDGVLAFHRSLIEATSSLAAAYKPQIAGFEAMGADGPVVLRETINLVRELAADVPVILDAKRADIGSTNDKYVEAVFGYYGADAVTVHPYLGPEAMKPFLDQTDKGVIVLCRTSNPGAGRYQDLVVDGRPLYQHIAQDVADTWNEHGNCGLVVGATYPDELAQVREIVGDMPILVPGVGAQGGDVAATVKAGRTTEGGLLIHASRSLMYAYESAPGAPVTDATRAAMTALHQEVEAALPH